MPAPVPAEPGHYTVRLDMLSELIFWFEEVKASSPLEVQVWVE
jgi:hypothetical protein